MLENIRVLIADDNSVVRSGLGAFLFANNMQLVGEAANGIEAVELCRQLQPDVVLMDLIMPEMGGVAAIEAIHRSWPHIHLIALTAYEGDGLEHDALRAGASTFLIKNLSARAMARVIKALYAGQPVPSSGISDEELISWLDGPAS